MGQAAHLHLEHLLLGHLQWEVYPASVVFFRDRLLYLLPFSSSMLNLVACSLTYYNDSD